MTTRQWYLATFTCLGLALPGYAQEVAKKETKQETKEVEKKEAKKANTTKLKVMLPPDATVELTIEGAKTRATGDIREFVTPALDPEKRFSYTITALIEPNNYTKITRTREVSFKANEEIVVDLRNKIEKDAEDIKIRWVPTPEARRAEERRHRH
jgi:uncharacterized protein (TIGR03000 family)